jgi:hypothetical protein
VIAAFGVFVAAIHTLVPLLGNTGLWISAALFLGCRGLFLHLAFPRLLRTL